MYEGDFLGFYFILVFIAIWLLYAIISKICDVVTGKTVKSLLSSKELSWQHSLDEKDRQIIELEKIENSLKCKISDLYDQLKSQKQHYENLIHTNQQSFDKQIHEILLSVSDRVKQETIALSRDIARRPYLQSTLVFKSIQNSDSDTCNRLCRVLNTSMHIEPPFDISCTIHSESGNTYQTTLNHCSCDDFSYRSKPCKHMYRLALELGLALRLQDVPSLIEQKIWALTREITSLEAERDDLRHRNSEYSRKLRQKDRDLTAKEHELERRENRLSELQSETLQTFPWLASYYTDCQQASDEKLIQHLRTKSHPAYTKAYEIEKLVRGELRECRIKAKEEEYQRRFYETMFPWLLEFKESSPAEAAEYVSLAESSDDDGKAFIRSGYLTHKEWSSLSDAERNQLALERYIKSDKSPWQVGIEYERYIGWLCEQKGYQVLYNGVISGYTDMGRDLIATKRNTVVIIQCKRWAKEKTIHEKHIFQLAGSVFEYRYKHPDKKVIGAFVTTIKFSPVATECGKLLGLKLYPEIPFNDYPRIKCNISKDNAKIYHLPMDQQYDAVKIDRDGEFYAFTVAEAESAGFRRAYRWHSV